MQEKTMTATTLAAALLADVPRYSLNMLSIEMFETPHGGWVKLPAVEDALTAAMDPALSERAGEVLPRLRKADEYEPLGHDGWEAADLITALLTQNAALRAEAQEMGAGMVTLSHEHSMERARANAAEAEVEKLRGALHNCVGMLDCLVAESGRSIEWGQEDPFRMGEWFEPDDLKQLEQARAALSATTEEGHE